ncbi:MAG: hypothetical protein QXW77_03015 [Candidatus Hadarchaeales archaeon]
MIGRKSGEIKLQLDHPELGVLRMRFPASEARQAARLLRGLISRSGSEGKKQKEVSEEEVAMSDLPPAEEIAEYIEGKGGRMIHASYELQEVFLRRKLRYPQEKAAGRRFSERHREARELLERRYGGRFKGEWRTRAGTAPYMIYEFSKDIGPPRSPPTAAGHRDESSLSREPKTA